MRRFGQSASGAIRRTRWLFVSPMYMAPSGPMQIQPQTQAPPPAPVPSGGGYYHPPPPTPARASVPPNPNARPEAAAGLDGWLADRLFR